MEAISCIAADEMRIQGIEKVNSAEINPHGEHRIAIES
jgi:5-enolpyruvylshikimate-3-phosphate synthase